jgi:hypothetical protein
VWVSGYKVSLGRIVAILVSLMQEFKNNKDVLVYSGSVFIQRSMNIGQLFKCYHGDRQTNMMTPRASCTIEGEGNTAPCA